MPKSENLADYVKRVRSEKGFSLNDVQNRSGGLISNAYVSKIENGYVTNVTPDKLKALAKGLGVPADEIFAIARGVDFQPTPKKRVAVLFHKFNEVGDDDLVEMEPIFKMLEAEVDRRIQIKEAQRR